MKLEVVIFKKLAEYDLDVCFESHEDRLGLMGPSGSGKSMVLKCIAGIMTPDAGRIVLDDEVLFDSDLKINISPQKRKIGYMFQNYALFDHMNVYQNIAAPLKAHHEDKQVIKEKVQQIMKDFQIDDLQKRYPRQLSGGQKQRVALARLLVYDTNLVLLDEPFSALDESLKEMLLNETKKKLDPLKDQIENDKHSIHELLTIASIAEKEANSYDDRTKVTQVIYKRLDLNMALGMDVTSYYGVQKEMTETITKLDLNDKNPYNTRVTSFIGLPVGPICNPSIDSIKASLNPADTDYVYFVADVATGNVYFATDEKGFNELVTKYIK